MSLSAQEQIKSSDELTVRTERVDDVALLIGAMQQIGLPQIIDNHIPVHGNQRELSWGWTTVIWLAYVVSEGDHRKVSVEEYIRGTKDSLSKLTGQKIDELDFSDDRLSNLLRYLSKKETWESIESDLNARTIRVHELPCSLARCDATTVSGYRDEKEGSLFQFGHSKDDPTLPQIKIMMGSLDPLGMPLITDVLSGERADDGLYVPVIKRMHDSLKKEGMLYVGDCKMSAFEIRLFVKGQKNHYLSPLPLTGKTSEEMDKWIQEGVSKDERGELVEVSVKNDKGEDVQIAKGYEFEREQSGFNGKEKIEWTERVLVVKSLSHGKQQEKGLEKRLETAQKKIEGLTPERGRGKKQITEEEVLKEKLDGIVKKHNVEGLLQWEYEKEIERKEKFVGKGRGSKNRQKEVLERVRYEVTKVSRHEEKIEQEKEKFGWKAYVTDASGENLNLGDAVKCYRQQYGIERIFNRLKSRLDISPLFVMRNDQIVGLTNLLTLGVRIYTLIEFVVRRSLKKDNAKLGGLHPENKRKETDRPTTERLLKAFSGITLTIIKTGGKTIRHLTPLSEVQKEILKRLGLDLSLYLNLEINKSDNFLTER